MGWTVELCLPAAAEMGEGPLLLPLLLVSIVELAPELQGYMTIDLFQAATSPKVASFSSNMFMV